MPSHTPEERKKKKRTKFQERLGLPGIDPQSAEGGKPIAIKGNVPVPAKEAPQLAATQAAGQVGLEQQAAGQAAIPQLEKAGAFEQVTPREVSLAPEEKIGGGLPFVGPSFSAIQSALGSLVKDTAVAGEAVQTGTKAFPLPPEGETVREAALREIKQRSFDKGISQSETIGTLIESIPVVGSLANKYAAGLTQTPSANAEAVIAEINKIKEAASTGQEKVRNGLEDPDFGLDRARSMEEDLARLEGRLKLLASTSPQLRANADNVNRIQEGVLEAREKVSRYRRAASFGLTASITGTGRVIPTDEQIFFELKQNQKR